MNKAALLIGVSEYNSESGLKPLPSAAEDVQAMQRVLLQASEFTAENITVLTNPEKHDVEEAIYQLFAHRQKEDLLLFYFSGHGIKDETGKLYFSLPTTRKNQNGSLIKHTAIPATVLHESMNDSRSTCQVLVLDCCFSGAFAKGLTIKNDGRIDIPTQLGGKGRAILTSSNSIEYSFHQDGLKLSVYTHFFVEGLEKGAADLDNDGLISADEMHTYVSEKVRQVAPKMTPQFFPGEQGHKIYLARSPGSLLTVPKLPPAGLQYKSEVISLGSTPRFALQSSTLQPDDENDLNSERFGANYYAKLRDFLKAGNWKKADRETADRMCEVIDWKENGWLRAKDIKNFPCQDLQNIDSLWIKYSNGQFGFSAQQKIYLEIGAEPDGNHLGNKIWKKLGNRVGWRMGGNWIWFRDIVFDKSAPEGHLPCYLSLIGEDYDIGHVGMWGEVWSVEVLKVFSRLSQRLVDCNVQ